MGEVTGYINIGPASRSDWVGRAATPTHVAMLWENDRPAWDLRSLSGDPGTSERQVWIPSSVEDILADGLLMLAVLVVGDELLATRLREAGADLNADPVELTRSSISQELRSHAYASLHVANLAVSVLTGSSLLQQLGVLADVAAEVEVLTTSYLRYESESERTEVGSLEL